MGLRKGGLNGGFWTAQVRLYLYINIIRNKNILFLRVKKVLGEDFEELLNGDVESKIL
jgi:hypothetical protein